MQVKFYLSNGESITTFLSQAAYDFISECMKSKKDIRLGTRTLKVDEIKEMKVLDEY